jgi:hypothetical protein
MAYFTGLQQSGEVDNVELAILEVHGGDLDGFILLRGDQDQLGRARRSRLGATRWGSRSFRRRGEQHHGRPDLSPRRLSAPGAPSSARRGSAGRPPPTLVDLEQDGTGQPLTQPVLIVLNGRIVRAPELSASLAAGLMRYRTTDK